MYDQSLFYARRIYDRIIISLNGFSVASNLNKSDGVEDLQSIYYSLV